MVRITVVARAPGLVGAHDVAFRGSEIQRDTRQRSERRVKLDKVHRRVAGFRKRATRAARGRLGARRERRGRRAADAARARAQPLGWSASLGCVAAGERDSPGPACDRVGLGRVEAGAVRSVGAVLEHRGNERSGPVCAEAAVAQGESPWRRTLRRAQGDVPEPRPPHRLRGGALPQRGRVLERGNRHCDAPRSAPVV